MRALLILSLLIYTSLKSFAKTDTTLYIIFNSAYREPIQLDTSFKYFAIVRDSALIECGDNKNGKQCWRYYTIMKEILPLWVNKMPKSETGYMYDYYEITNKIHSSYIIAANYHLQHFLYEVKNSGIPTTYFYPGTRYPLRELNRNNDDWGLHPEL